MKTMTELFDEQAAAHAKELDQLRQRVAEAEAEAHAAELLAADRLAKLALAEQDVRRYRVVRKKVLWTPSADGCVRWVLFLRMDDPRIDTASLTDDSVAQCFDAAIDASGEGHAD